MSWKNQGAAKTFGVAQAVGMAPVLTLYNAAGTSLGTAYVSPTITSASVTHSFASDETKDANGDIDAVIYHGEYIEISLEIIPTGTSNTSGTAGYISALLGMTQPPIGSSASISGAPIFPAGPFADAINVDVSSATTAAAWRYAGGWSSKFSSEGHGTVTATFRRYPKLLGMVAITS